jgi:hypothetical protein
MKVAALTLLLVFSYCPSQGQDAAFRLLRYDEDYSKLQYDTAGNWYKSLKYRPLKPGDVYISFGGEIRYQYFWYKNPAWGNEPDDQDGFILNRFLGHADLHYGKYFRVFTEIQSSLVTGSPGEKSPVDENPLDLHQLFLDLVIFDKKQQKLLLRLGRQELSYGSQRLISVRELPNNRQAFDGIKAIFRTKNLRADAFYSTYVTAKKRIFNDRFLDRSAQLWGAYFAFSQTQPTPNLDVYYLGLKKKRAVFDDGMGNEVRHSVGTRIWKNSGEADFDLEAVYQVGKLSEATVRAWTVSLNTSYQFEEMPTSPILGLKTELISGDKTYHDGTINTFNPLYPKGAYFGLAALIGPYNLKDLHPYLQIELGRRVTWSTDYDFFWRMSRHDGLYAVNGRLIHSGKNIVPKYIGDQLGTEIAFQFNPFIYFRAEFTWFNAGPFLKQAGAGADILMAGATATLKF